MHDVIIIGAGIVGCATARELSRRKLDVLVLERENDAAGGASKANSGIVHAGYDAKPGTDKARFNMLGAVMFEEASRELGFVFNMCGSYVVCLDEADLPKLQDLKERGETNGVLGLEIIDGDKARQQEPSLSSQVVGALYAPTSGIVSPYEMTYAYAENAAANGVTFQFGANVIEVSAQDLGFTVLTTLGEFKCQVLINAAGINADTINNALSHRKINITPRKGEYVMLDRTDSVKSTIFQLPTKMGKGVLVSPTVDKTVILGPTATDVDSKDDTTTTEAGLNEILQNCLISVPQLQLERAVASFSGLRAHSDEDDFVIGEASDVPKFFNAAGIESPGLTSAPAIARYLEGLVTESLDAQPNPNFVATRKPPFSFRRATNEERAVKIVENSDYGRIVCRCEMVTRGEILDALRSPLPARDTDAIKRRTRTGMGRCQGGFCSGSVIELMAKELGLDLHEVTKSGGNSAILRSLHERS